MMRFFQGLKNTKQIFSEVVRKFVLSSAVEVFMLLYVYISNKNDVLSQLFWGGWMGLFIFGHGFSLSRIIH